MRRADAIERLQSYRSELVELGAGHLSPFGSMARDEAGPDSDVDVVIGSADRRPLGLFGLTRISETLKPVLTRPIDVVSQSGFDHARELARKASADLFNVF